jgi:peptidoglycan hydrolase-like amidase
VRRLGFIAAVAALALAASTSAQAKERYAIEGRGWGHGIGMSQWGAYGYARHGWSYERILAHYYPGTRLVTVPQIDVRVLVTQGRRGLRIACAGRIVASDRSGHRRSLRPRTYRLGPRLRLRLPHRWVALRPPVVFDCPTAPLVLDGRAYHGQLVVRRPARRLYVVNTVPIEQYLRGVVGGEMPDRWRIAALAAQAVAARTYALATLKANRPWDLYADTRSQVYGGIAYESARADRAIERTRSQVLFWNGAPASTFFFSTSGGKTAAIRDVWPRARQVPYLRSVRDPFERPSPHRRWGPVTISARALAKRLHLRRATSVKLVRTPSGRVATVWVSGRPVPGWRFRSALKLPSTWFSVVRVPSTTARR